MKTLVYFVQTEKKIVVYVLKYCSLHRASSSELLEATRVKIIQKAVSEINRVTVVVVSNRLVRSYNRLVWAQEPTTV
jgi:hypothetical protein